MKVKVRFFTKLREITKRKEEEFEVEDSLTVRHFLKILTERYGCEFEEYVWDRFGRPHGHLQFLVNGKNIRSMCGLETKLKDGDTLVILPPVGGG